MWSYNNAYIAHHGILGQRWGIRKGPPYPIPDGQHSSQEEKAEWKRSIDKKTIAQKHNERVRKSAAANRSLLSDTEIRKRIERLKLEKELREMTAQEINPGRVVTNKLLSEIGKDVVKKYATTVATGAALYLTKAFVSKEFDKKAFADSIFNGGAKKK